MILESKITSIFGFVLLSGAIILTPIEEEKIDYNALINSVKKESDIKQMEVSKLDKSVSEKIITIKDKIEKLEGKKIDTIFIEKLVYDTIYSFRRIIPKEENY